MTSPNKDDAFNQACRFQVLTNDVYHYPVTIVNKLRYKKGVIPNKEYFCELTYNNWLSIRDTPASFYSKVGSIIVHREHTECYPIPKEHLIKVTGFKSDSIICNNNIGKEIIITDYDSYLVYKG